MVIYSGGVIYNMCLPIPRTCSVKKLVNSLFIGTDSKTTRFNALCVCMEAHLHDWFRMTE